MAVTIRIPTPLRSITGGNAAVEVEADTVGAALDALGEQYPGINKHLRDKNGRVRRFVNIFLKDEDVRFLQKEATPVEDGDELLIVPSIAGGWA